MRKVQIIAVIAAILVVALVGAGFANGAKPKAAPTQPPVQAPSVAPETPVQVPPPAVPAAGPVTTPAVCPTFEYSTNQLVPLTVAQAWEMSCRNEVNFTKMVQQLAELSAHNRCITLPDSADAGTQIGRMIRQNAEANSNQLLYTVVDNAIVAYKASNACPPAAGAGPSSFTYTANQLLPLTVAQSWQLSGRNNTKMLRMIRTLMYLSAENRGITISDISCAENLVSKSVRQQLTCDPNMLLYEAVDNAVLQYAASQVPATNK